MNILLVYSHLASILLSYSSITCNSNHEKNSIIVNAGNYELKLYEIFQQYWQNNRTITEDLRNILKIPKKPNLKIEELPDCRSPKICLTCRAFSFSSLTHYQTHSDHDLDEYLYDLCTMLAGIEGNECRGMINVYVPSIRYILKHRANELSSDRICGIIFQTFECSSNKYLIDFTIDAKHETVLTIPKTNQFNERTMESSSLLTILHLSDFHYDPHYAVGSSSDCLNYICCRNTSIPRENSTHTAGYWGDYKACDSPSYLIENICSQVATNHKNIDLIYYTGDFADHFSWLTTKSSVKHTIEFVTQQIKQYFPNIPVVAVLGNHDISPSDAFVFASALTVDDLNSKWLYEFTADLWSDWLPESALIKLRHGGYYDYVFRNSFRIIVLNNNLCFTSNVWLLYGAEDMIIQLKWLRDTLATAEANAEKVHIIGHVPPNTSSCIRAWNREFNKLIRQFAHIISGQFNGHTHTDEFTLFYSTNHIPAPVNVAWNGGSGTSFVGLNSNYRLYTVERNTYEVVDFETFIFNLTEANLAPNQPPKWFKEYSFRDAFGVTDLSPFTLSNLVNNTFRHDRHALHKYWSYKFKLADPKMQAGCDDDCLEKLRLITNGEVEDDFF